jgi:phosphatidylserine/phosphatidylglycerophosphate/cardiolipin synthase-like enzyme
MTHLDGMRALANEASLLVKRLPTSVVESLAETLSGADSGDWPSVLGSAVEGIAHPHHRSHVLGFLDNCRRCSGDLPRQAISAALLTAAVSEQAHREHQSVELVWTGPDVGVVPLRRTEQVMLQVIENATQRLTVVSYAVYNIPHICDALLRAAARGLAIRVVVESPDRLEGQNTYSTLAALGPSVAKQCEVYLWPLANRATDEVGKPGLLHVKCAVADGRWLFLSSANLTEYAFTLNMELGVLIYGGSLPSQVEAHFDRMIQTGVLAAP